MNADIDEEWAKQEDRTTRLQQSKAEKEEQLRPLREERDRRLRAAAVKAETSQKNESVEERRIPTDGPHHHTNDGEALTKTHPKVISGDRLGSCAQGVANGPSR